MHFTTIPLVYLAVALLTMWLAVHNANVSPSRMKMGFALNLAAFLSMWMVVGVLELVYMRHGRPPTVPTGWAWFGSVFKSPVMFNYLIGTGVGALLGIVSILGKGVPFSEREIKPLPRI